ncbi:class I SAM-dependent methyltransferase [Paenibacillus guangzhouensis]|uniref:class I SAM-dependent methyltransferase n=1 Tax=Paenibacillus guangzhouensis TaxID=1473112 RepID=UPI001266B608|nr:methyltransferase domain-containing protein [Paenibacillus guangzhouensis]
MNWAEDKWLFLQKFMVNPKEIGSITPSSKFLAHRMLNEVEWEAVHCMGELGSGTGAITAHLAELVYQKKCSLDPVNVFLFEKDKEMRDRLQEAYPKFHVAEDALCLRAEARRHNLGAYDCIISGLPFFNFSPLLRHQLMEEIYQSLRPGGQFIAFQYSLQMKRELSRYFDVEKIKFVAFNIPPACVYVCRKNRIEDEVC